MPIRHRRTIRHYSIVVSEHVVQVTVASRRTA